MPLNPPPPLKRGFLKKEQETRNKEPVTSNKEPGNSP